MDDRQDTDSPASPSDGPGWREHRGPIVLVNLAFTVLLVLALHHLIAKDTSAARVLAVYGKRYALTIALLAMGILASGYVVLLGGRGRNRALAVVLLAGTFSAEWALRRFEASRAYQAADIIAVPYLAFSGQPNLDRIDDMQAKHMGNLARHERLQFNELGYRSPMPAADKGVEYRVIMLGGSVVVNGSPVEKSIPARLEALFHQAGRENVRVYNWGAVSCVSGQELAHLVYRVTDVDPDLVIVLDGWNDVLSPWMYDPRPGYPYNFLVTEDALSRASRSRPFLDGVGSLASRSRVIDFALGGRFSRPWQLRAQLRSEVAWGSPAWESRIAEVYASNVERMAVVGRGFGFKTAFFLQPLLASKKERVGGETRLPLDRAWRSLVRRVYPAMSHGAQARLGRLDASSTKFFDISDLLADSHEDLFWDMGHVNNRGNELIAARMLELLDHFPQDHHLAGAARQAKESIPKVIDREFGQERFRKEAVAQTHAAVDPRDAPG